MKFVDNKKKYSLLKLGAVVIAALVILDIIGRKYEKRYFTVPIKLRIKPIMHGFKRDKISWRLKISEDCDEERIHKRADSQTGQ